MKHLGRKLLLLLNYITVPMMFRAQPTSSIHQFTATSINGKAINFRDFKGKKLLIVNTASKCGLTPQYEQLQRLHEQYKDKGLVIIGFPSNDFAHQEPGSNTEVESFCQVNYGVSFLMMEKITVKGGEIHPVYKWLTSKSQNGVLNSRVYWNFQKYLVDEQGHFVDMVIPWKNPDCKRIIEWLNKG